MKTALPTYFKGDRIIWMVAFLLMIVSLLVVYSATGTLAYRFKEGNTTYYFLKQLMFLGVGFMIMYFAHLMPYRLFSKFGKILLYASIPLLLFTLLFGANLNQASRWLVIPGLGFTIQTSDLAKLALIIFVSKMLAQKQDQIKDFKGTFLPLIAHIGIVCLLILPANFSTAALLGLVCMLLLFIGRISMKHLGMLVGIAVVAFGLFILIASKTSQGGRIGTWQSRIERFVGSKDGGPGYQVEQGKIAIATGGIFGKGPGNSTQRNYLPHPYSDFIYAIIIEEYGIVGGVIVLFLYLFLLFRAGVIVRKSKRTFPAFLAVGLTLMLVFQALVNMAVAVHLFPVTGQPLPMVSMGGSSLLFTSLALGIILSVSRSMEEAENDKKIEEDGIKANS
ncbi:FtsW/RodA/SpoVE family cell cycle protein [Williamwhitmania taraxaci]|uniref:Probable peptidoglycan glycosyltransferase FtsW n=1 Tax=Williamwhitmania taraxaci TaxID=1640674 RepID=A0A1G6L6G1_9BACT|nr:FtsW/RodA/SpoVE family cell cycle protein [Williamwhitmania taraxaci]SDC38902.1 cell division protein FtsW [Williamwhitmania taraxaci]